MKSEVRKSLVVVILVAMLGMLMPVGVWAEEENSIQTDKSEPVQEMVDSSGMITTEENADDSMNDLILSITLEGMGDNYPAEWKSAPDNAIDSWRYYVRNCTSWVAWALHDRNGFEMPPAIGDATVWGTWARNHGYAVDSNPQIGSVAWTGGHVAWVKSVNNDGTVTIEEYNYNWSGTYNCRNIARGSVQYIHFKDIDLPPSDTTPPTISTGRITDVNAEGFTVRCSVSDNVAVTSVRFATWLTNGHDGNAIWTNGWVEGNEWVFRVKYSEHYNSERGKYFIHVYAYDAVNNTSACWPTEITIDEKPPVISEVAVTNVDPTGYTVKCKVTDESGIDRVQFPTWTVANGQDDLNNWPTDNEYSGTIQGETVTYRVKDSAHNFEKGEYITHIYAYDKFGNRICYKLDTIKLENTGIPVVQEMLDGNTYLLFDDAISWPEAKDKAEALGGHLVTITSQEEQLLIEKMVQSGQRGAYFMGGTDEGHEGIFTWITGESFGLAKWSSKQPDNSNGNENYLEMYRSGYWNDNTKIDKRGYIVEKESTTGGGSESKLISYLGKDSGGNYYRYSATEFNNSFLAYQINPALASAKMYQQYLNSQCKIVGLEDQVKGYMDYNATASACLKAQIWGQTFDINVYFASSDAKVFEETVENVRIVDKDGNIS